ncbi:galactokinase [Frankia sp. Cppng1_Ct_nod]|uniref:GHMP family kinase ATP-binding protein n=1 Tax=Frankia sp. Cppng1_Ct_nod TaxID=2897162 RepID=UPI0010412552|nr:galactokinase [Frankia sp. Cppng1_Ct_nod]
MIITRTPLRITLGGGGTDLPSYFERFGGLVLAAAINRYVYVGLKSSLTDEYVLSFPGVEERAANPAALRHPIARVTLQQHPAGQPVELSSMADLPAGTGLGSSGAFTVGLLRALHTWTGAAVESAELAAQACEIEIDRLGLPVGKQDQYVAALGGLICLRFESDGRVRATRPAIPARTITELQNHLLLFFTGYTRSAARTLTDQHERTRAGDRRMIDNLHRVKEIGLCAVAALEACDTDGFAASLRAHWELKRARSDGMTNTRIDSWYAYAMANGALGGKLVGAGGGGFLLFFAADPDRLRPAMEEVGLREVPFRLAEEGCIPLTADRGS